MKNIILSIASLPVMMGMMWFAVTANATTSKVTICHATGSASNPWVRTVVSENGTGGHFENNGTPKSGHEDDVLLQGEQDCPYPTPYATPYSTPSYPTPEYTTPSYATPDSYTTPYATPTYTTPSGGGDSSDGDSTSSGGSSGDYNWCEPGETQFCKQKEVTYPTPYPTPVVVEHEGKG